MQYDFDRVIDRGGNFAAKYEERIKKFGTDQVIPLWVADMDFRTAQPIIDAILKRAEQGIYGYTFRPESYFRAISTWQERRHGWRPDPGLMSFAPGVVPALSELVREFTRPGDSVLIQTPVYPEFYDVVEAWEGRRVLENQLVETDGYYRMNLPDLEEKLRQGPKLFLLCSPHNPVGRVWTREELTACLELCLRYHVPVVADEIHSDLLLWGNEHIPTASLSPEIAANTITCVSSTKTFNLAGLQAAAAVFPNEEWKRRFDGFWGALDIHRNNCFSLVAVEAACREGDEWLEQLLRYIEGNMTYLHDFCEENLPGIRARIPESTYLLWLDCRGLGMEPRELNRFLVERAGLGLNNGADFCRGLSGFMRLNTACPRSVLERAMKQLKAAVDSL